MFGGGKGMGGGGGGMFMLRTVGRAVTRAGVTGSSNLQESLSSSSSTNSPTSTTTSRHTHKPNTPNNLSISSGSPFCGNNLPISANSGLPTRPSFSSSSYCDDFEWVSVDGSEVEDERANGFFDDFVIGPVPSSDEVQNAVSALQQVFDATSYTQLVRDKFAYNLDKDVADQISSPAGLGNQVSSAGSEVDWVEPSLHLCTSRMLQRHGSDRVYDAFRLLQSEPSVQKMVFSLSSDKAVWDAVLSNEVVRELREAYYAAEKNNNPESSDETCDDSDTHAATSIVRRIFDNTRMKVMEAIEKISKLVNELFKPPDDEKTTAGTSDPFEEKLRTSFLISVVVLLIVIVTRAHRA